MIWSWLKKLVAQQPTPKGNARKGRDIRALYDAARTTAENRNHWAAADSLGPVLSTSLADRKILRQRARYEVANNCYAKGMVAILANNLIGIGGPRLQLLSRDQEINGIIEQAWQKWSRQSRLVAKLRTLTLAKVVDGEAFALFHTNPKLPTSVKLDLRLIEADQVTTPAVHWSPGFVDGIDFDEAGNPTKYHILKYHPGDYGSPLEYEIVPAGKVVHWFRADRPGQPRGISELTPALELFAQLRRFTLATLDAAETAAHFSAVLKTSLPPDDSDDVEAGTPFDEWEITRRMMVTLPESYEMQQFKSEHPQTTHEMFVMGMLREIGRALQMPWNIVAGDSSKANFASAKLDYLVYRQAIDVEREDCETEVVEPIFREWLNEATAIPGLLPENIPAVASSLPHVWHWPAWDPVDILSEEQAATEGLANKSRTLASIASPRGEDWREIIRQRVVEEKYEAEVRKEMNLPEKEQEVPDDSKATV